MLEEIRARCAGHITAGLPPDSLESEQHSVLTEVTDPEEDKAEQPNNELAPAAGFGMEDAMAESAVAQTAKMAEQQAILESIQDEAYVEANRAFLRREQAESDALFAELDAEIEAEEAGAEQPEAPELQLPPMLLESGTEIIVISDEK